MKFGVKSPFTSVLSICIGTGTPDTKKNIIIAIINAYYIEQILNRLSH